ncbi:hypothetical protein OCK74_16955 [Chitinophagaceae bacterium LB-8]|uniref:Uncharacterized protein n=1 Tax=Paraflavisolibacter caeni TaxID=2982496 RepID=A0A9X2XWZ6_9BACT|nr:hypothetical protein [Paraflavisolibacter caeni]MCU7550811.1 hypothetical protein [Paraflavisolibacter caeni]
MDEFKPINNEILEELEVLAAMKKLCYIKFEAENGGTPEIKARITGIYLIGDEQYLKTEEGLSIRLDKLLQVDDKPLKKNC